MITNTGKNILAKYLVGQTPFFLYCLFCFGFVAHNNSITSPWGFSNLFAKLFLGFLVVF